MPVSAIIALLALAGCGLVFQNRLMVAVAAATPGPWAALMVNSLVGIVLIGAVGFSRHGTAFAADTVSALRWWFVLPGILGTVFILASVTGYARIGAAATIAILIAAQLVTGLLVDLAAEPFAMDVRFWTRLAGALLLVTGCLLVNR